MSLRTSVSIDMAVGFNNALDDLAFERQKVEMLDTCEDVATKTKTLAASDTDIAVDFDDVTESRLIYIEADGEIDVKFGDVGNTAIRLSRMVDPASTQAPNLCAYGLFTVVTDSLFLTNPSSTAEVKAKICIVGNLVTD